MALHWMSFCDPDKPEGTQFLGVAIVEAFDLGEAMTIAWRRGCNPGGEVGSFEIPADKHDQIPDELRHVLLSKGDLIELGWIGAE